MSVTIPTAPFDLGGGQHGVIVEGEDACDHNAPCSHPNARVNDCCYTQPPQWVLDALEPCFLCEGRGRIQRTETDHRPMRCTDCHDGKPVVEFQVPCPGSRTACPPFSRAMCRFGGEPHPAGRWTVTEALPIRHVLDPIDDQDEVVIDQKGRAWIHGNQVHIPGDPADLIGKYLVIVEAAA